MTSSIANLVILILTASMISKYEAKRVNPADMCTLPQEGDLRLLDGSTSYNGRLEVYHDGEWGTICDSGFDMTDAKTICHELGYEFGAAAFHPGAFFGEGSGPIWLGDLECTDYTTSILSCRTQAWREHGCEHSRDVGVTCATDGALRLVNGGAAHKGLVEVFHSDSQTDRWFKITDSNFTLEDGNLICRVLNYPAADNAHLTDDYVYDWRGYYSYRSWLQNIQCSDYSMDIASCRTQPWQIVDEYTELHISVTCLVDGALRLVNGPTGSSGRVEVFYSGQWGTVCEDEFDEEDANLICRQLSFSEGPAVVHTGAYFGSGSGPIWLDNLGCTGNSSDLASCLTQAVGDHDCTHESDVGVTCATNPALRLVGGSAENEGTIQFLYNGTWGTICNGRDEFKINESNVICHALGFIGAVPRDQYQHNDFGENTGPVWMRIDCPSSTSDFASCLPKDDDYPYGNDDYYCETHRYDVGVICRT